MLYWISSLPWPPTPREMALLRASSRERLVFGCWRPRALEEMMTIGRSFMLDGKTTDGFLSTFSSPESGNACFVYFPNQFS